MTMNQQLTAIIVHDLKNALGALEGKLSALTEDLDRAQAIQAHAACVALREKLIGFLTLYKASEQGLTARIEAVSPDDFLRALLSQHASSRPEVTLAIDTTTMPAIAFFDEHLTGMALDAGLQNATRFARTRITIACTKSENDLVFTIRDDGPGLGGVEAQPSTGLGMALCAAIAAAHHNENRHGSVQLQTLADGGALFTLRLP